MADCPRSRIGGRLCGVWQLGMTCLLIESLIDFRITRNLLISKHPRASENKWKISEAKSIQSRREDFNHYVGIWKLEYWFFTSKCNKEEYDSFRFRRREKTFIKRSPLTFSKKISSI